jgi:hypothetical protein
MPPGGWESLGEPSVSRASRGERQRTKTRGSDLRCALLTDDTLPTRASPPASHKIFSLE